MSTDLLMATKDFKLILTHNNITNGMMKIQVMNLDEIYLTNNLQFNLSYQFHLNKNEKYYQNKTWTSSKFNISCITTSNEFFLRIPLFLLSYTLEYKLTITTFTGVQTNIFSSQNYIATIPSITIESTFQIGDIIDFSTQNSNFVTEGTVLTILENDTIKVKNNETNDIVNVHVSKVFRRTLLSSFVIDITNRNQAEIDLILRTNNERCMDTYKALLMSLNCIIIDQDYDRNDLKYLRRFMCINICYFLYDLEYNLKIECLFDNSVLEAE
eukprot:302076_1